MEEKNLLVINIGDVYELKKTHPCGSSQFEVIRSGADCKLKCMGCGHIIMVDRVQLRKMIKSVIKKV